MSWLLFLWACGASKPAAPAHNGTLPDQAEPAPVPAPPASQEALLADYPGQSKRTGGNEISGAVLTVFRPAPGSIAGAPCGAEIEANPDFWACTLTEPYSLGGYAFQAGGRIEVSYGNPSPTKLLFESLAPPTDTFVIGSVRCMAQASLYDNGALMGCLLAADQEVKGVSLPAGGHISLNKDGSLHSLTIETDAEIGGTTHRAGHLWFDASGAVKNRIDLDEIE